MPLVVGLPQLLARARCSAVADAMSGIEFIERGGLDGLRQELHFARVVCYCLSAVIVVMAFALVHAYTRKK